MAAPVITRGLSPADQNQIRDALAGGRRPKVVFTHAAGQIAGQTGQVVAVADPTHSDEWITVRFGKDELPFSPADLAMPGKAVPAKAVPAKAVPAKAMTGTGVTGSAGSTRSVPAKPPRRTEAVGPESNGATVEPEFLLDKPIESAPRAGASPATPPAPEPTAEVKAAPEPRPGKPAKAAKPPASLVVTLSYTEREWTLAATQGTKALAKPYLISPADALRMVALVDMPVVHEAVENIIAAERAEAEGKAAKLRAELAEIEARLAELAQQPQAVLAGVRTRKFAPGG